MTCLTPFLLENCVEGASGYYRARRASTGGVSASHSGTYSSFRHFAVGEVLLAVEGLDSAHFND